MVELLDRLLLLMEGVVRIFELEQFGGEPTSFESGQETNIRELPECPVIELPVTDTNSDTIHKAEPFDGTPFHPTDTVLP